MADWKTPLRLTENNANGEMAASQRFVTTHWSVVLQASNNDPSIAKAALAELFQAYWFPLYAYARRRGNDPDEAGDLTQEFFARLIEKTWLSGIKPCGGRFRSFLLTAFNRFLANEYHRQNAARRGGGYTIVSLDQVDAEERYLQEPYTNETPEKIFERRWALALLDQSLVRLNQEARAAGKERQFQSLQPFLSREPSRGEYDAVGVSLGLSASAVAAAVCRLRRQYRQMLRACVAETLDNPEELNEEMQHLMAALG